jgi:glycosyl transferase family 25
LCHKSSAGDKIDRLPSLPQTERVSIHSRPPRFELRTQTGGGRLPMWPSYIINLEENVTRLRNSSSQMDMLGIEWKRVDGVNGWTMTEEEVAAVYARDENSRRAKNPLVRPEIGCYLSHIRAWQMIAEDRAHPGGFIFEDDFAAAPELRRVLELLSRPDPDWDVVKLFSFDRTPRMVTDAELGDGMRIGTPYRVPTCLIGYGITREAAAQLSETAIPFFRPVDEDMKFFWEKDLRIALVTPPPVTIGSQDAETGTISGTRRAEAKHRRFNVSRALKNLRYQLSYEARLRYFRLRGGRA